MEKINFILVEEDKGWTPNINEKDFPASVKDIYVRESGYGGWNIIATPTKESYPGQDIQVASNIKMHESAEKTALLWLAGRHMGEPGSSFRRAAQTHQERHPKCPKAKAAYHAACQLIESADQVKSLYSAWDHEGITKMLPRAIKAAQAAVTAFATKSKSNNSETHAADEAAATALKAAITSLELAKGRARHFQLAAGLDAEQLKALDKGEANSR